jgi:hypothetical protein
MKKIFKLLNKYARVGINILVKFFLSLVYLVLLFPFAVVVRFCTDYLQIKGKLPCWILLNETENEKELLSRQ